MDIIPLRPGFGAELRGVTLADVAAHDAAYQLVRAAFEEYSVLVFRNQDVTNERQLAFSRRFGPPEITKVGSLGTGTHFVILTTIGQDGKVVPADHRYAMRNKANQLWHTDSSFKSVPALASILSGRTIPDNGGETEFASTRLAFERLDPTTREKLESSFAWHHYGHSRKKIADGLATTEELAALPPQCWRMVWRNPVNGRGAPSMDVGRVGSGGCSCEFVDQLLARDRVHAFDRIGVRGEIKRAAAIDRISPHHAPALRRQRRELLGGGETVSDLFARMPVMMPGERIF